MYRIEYVQYDCFKTIEVVNKDIANREYKELIDDATVTELKTFILTIDIKFSSSTKVYTYFLDKPIYNYRFAKLATGDLVQIIRTKYRTKDELKALARSQGFSYSQFKVLHGTAIK